MKHYVYYHDFRYKKMKKARSIKINAASSVNFFITNFCAQARNEKRFHDALIAIRCQVIIIK